MNSDNLQSRKGLLVRVGIDSIYGKWNSPVNVDTGEFVYIPIPENDKFEFKPGLAIKFNYFSDYLNSFSISNNFSNTSKIELPEHLNGKNMHLDPDFSHLTYGDNGKRRGKTLKDVFNRGDFVVFYAGLRPIQKFSCPLYYAIIGFYQIQKVVEAKDVKDEDSYLNAHTRKKNPEPSDVIVFAEPAYSGRLNNAVLIGEYRNGAYRIKSDLLEKWGGISAKNGFIQRSAVPPRFCNPDKFLTWFNKQDIQLIACNN
ncbi:MAG: hypothetical protein ACM3MI_11615 [Clostridiales bacterium]